MSFPSAFCNYSSAFSSLRSIRCESAYSARSIYKWIRCMCVLVSQEAYMFLLGCGGDTLTLWCTLPNPHVHAAVESVNSTSGCRHKRAYVRLACTSACHWQSVYLVAVTAADWRISIVVWEGTYMNFGTFIIVFVCVCVCACMAYMCVCVCAPCGSFFPVYRKNAFLYNSCSSCCNK